jgi:alpha-L-fucosidase
MMPETLVVSYDASVGQNTLFILNMPQLEACFAEETSVRELPDLGGGSRSIIESVFSLKSYSGGLDHGKYTLS